MRTLGSLAITSVLLMGCAESSPGMLPAQNPAPYANGYAPYPQGYPQGAPPIPGMQGPGPIQAPAQLLVVTPVFYVPADVSLDPQQELVMSGLVASQLALARDRYAQLLQGETFQWSLEQPVTYRSRLSTDQLEASPPDTAHTMARELLAWRGENRMNSRHVFLTLIVRPPGRPCGASNGIRCMGGARTFNGAPGTGGGFVQLEANNLLDGKHFQSSLQHELGHAFGLSHADCHGQSMHEGASIMSYNKAHWSYGLNQSSDPGVFTAEDLVTLARNRLAFPRLGQTPMIQELSRRPLVRANGECHLGPMDASIGPLQAFTQPYAPAPQPAPYAPQSYAPSPYPQQPYTQQPYAPQPYAPPVQPYAPQSLPPQAAPEGVPSGHGYELFYDGRRVSGADAQFYTREHAARHCADMVRLHPQVRVSCSFDGATFYGSR